MNKITTLLIVVFSIALVMVFIVELIIKRNTKIFIIEIMLMAAFTYLLHRYMGFPNYRQSFGGISPLSTIILMFISAALGICAHYIYYLKPTSKIFSRDLFKALLITPLILLPLLNSINDNTELGTVQLVSFNFLAFQNGFFWKEIFNKLNSN